MSAATPVWTKYYVLATMEDGESSPVTVTGIPDNTLVHAGSVENTDGSPDGLFTIDLYDSDQAFIGTASIADMGTAGQDLQVLTFAVPRPALGGLIYGLVGDSDSEDQEVKVNIFLEKLA